MLAFRVVTPELEAFAAFLDAHDAHGVKEWADTTYDPTTPEGVQVQASKPFVHQPGIFVDGDLELVCSACEDTLQSRAHRLRPFEAFTATPQETLRFRQRVLDVSDSTYKAPFPFDESGKSIRTFLKAHDGHSIKVCLVQETKPRALGSPRRLWSPPTWPVEASERWLGPTEEALDGLHHRSAVRRCGALSAITDPLALGYVVSAFDDPEPSVRAAAALAIARLGDRRGIRPLGASLGDESPEVVGAVERALSALNVPLDEAKRQSRTLRGPYGVTSWSSGPPAGGLQGIERALRDPRPNVRLGAIEAIDALTDADAIPLLLFARFDPSYLIRIGCARQLKKRQRDTRSLDALLGLITDVSASVAYQAIEALPAPPPVKSLLPVMDAWLAGSGMSYARPVILALASRDQLPQLRGALSHEDPRVRAEAVALVAAIGGGGETAQLLPTLDDPSLQVRLGAVTAMGELRTPEAMKALAALGKRSSRRLRAEAVRVLSTLNTPVSLDALESFLADPDMGLRRSVAHTLAAGGTARQVAVAQEILNPLTREGRRP